MMNPLSHHPALPLPLLWRLRALLTGVAVPYVPEPELPLYEIKANLFKGLAHPMRIRVLELLNEAPGQTAPVSHLLAETGLEASHLSQHLATLRRHGVVTSTRVGSTVFYRLAHPKIGELLAIAREFLTDRLAATQEQLQAVARMGSAGAPAGTAVAADAGTRGGTAGARAAGGRR